MMDSYHKKYSVSFLDEKTGVKLDVKQIHTPDDPIMQSSFVQELSERVAKKKPEMQRRLDVEMQKYRNRIETFGTDSASASPTKPEVKKETEAQRSNSTENTNGAAPTPNRPSRGSISRGESKKFSTFTMLSSAMYFNEPIRLYSEDLPEDFFSL